MESEQQAASPENPQDTGRPRSRGIYLLPNLFTKNIFIFALR